MIKGTEPECVDCRPGAEAALRDLGGRLIRAQEEERSRIARELHDDLSQRLALLSIELEQLSRKIPARQGDLRARIQDAWAKAQEISVEIHRIS
jgi:signal transduction histidine kinase